MSTNSGGKAFPSNSVGFSSGMDLREWYAGLAMQALIARGGPGTPVLIPDLINGAFAAADAMIEQINSEGGRE